MVQLFDFTHVPQIIGTGLGVGVGCSVGVSDGMGVAVGVGSPKVIVQPLRTSMARIRQKRMGRPTLIKYTWVHVTITSTTEHNPNAPH
jgi:hypothetical protein